MATKKKPVHRTKPWFFFVGLGVLLLGGVITAGMLVTKLSPQPKASQTIMLQKVQSEKSVPAPTKALKIDEVKEWIDLIKGSLEDLAGVFMALGGAVMLWLNIKEKRRELADAPDEGKGGKR